MFCIDREMFIEIMESIMPYMKKRNLKKAHNWSGASVLLKTHLTVMLHWLAQASYLNLCFGFGIANYNHSGGIFDGCVLAVDGLGLATQQPFKWEVKHHMTPISKRGFCHHCDGKL
jgi:hypothetical protein